MSAAKSKKPKKPPQLYWLHRSYVGTPFVSLWLCLRDDGAHTGLLWGELLPDAAEAILSQLALPVEREQSALVLRKSITPPDCVPVEEQKTLF